MAIASSSKTVPKTAHLQTEDYCYKKDVDEDQQQYVRYASMISDNDLDFLSTLEAENGTWDPIRQSSVYKNGIREPSYGFCQIHSGYHPEVVGDERFFSDPYWQLDKCYEYYKGGVTFYGYYNRWKVQDRFVCPF